MRWPRPAPRSGCRLRWRAGCSASPPGVLQVAQRPGLPAGLGRRAPDRGAARDPRRRADLGLPVPHRRARRRGHHRVGEPGRAAVSGGGDPRLAPPPPGQGRASPARRCTTTCSPWSTRTAGCATSSPRPPRTRCGSPTSPSTPPARASCTCARSRTATPNKIVGYSIAERMAPPWRSRRCATRSRSATRRHDLPLRQRKSVPGQEGPRLLTQQRPARLDGPGGRGRGQRRDGVASSRCCRRTS